MKKVCEACQFRAESVDQITCPLCGKALRTSFLAFDAATETPHVPIPAPKPPAGSVWNLIGERLVGSGIGLVAVLLLMCVAAWGVGSWAMRAGTEQKSDLAGKIRVGMPIRDVVQLLDPGSFMPSKPGVRDNFPADDLEDGSIEYEGNGIKLSIVFAGGRVTSVKEAPSPSGPGAHNYQLTIE